MNKDLMPLLTDSFSFEIDEKYKDSISRKVTELKDNQGTPALEVVVDATHGGYINKNYVLYTSEGLHRTAKSFFKPFPKPVLVEHDDEGSPIGRVIDARFISLEVEGGDAQKKVASKKPNSKIRLKALITDMDAIQKISDGRFLTVSISGRPDTVPKCGVCGKDIESFMGCEDGHVRGKQYDKKVGHYIIDGMTYGEVSFVNKPADQSKNHAASLVSMEIVQAPNLSDDVKKAMSEAVKNKEKVVVDAEKDPKADCPKCEDEPWAEDDIKTIPDTECYDEWEMGDAKLTAEARKKLPDSAFCGPSRSYPAHDCAHAGNAKARATQQKDAGKISASQAAKIIACANRKQKSLGCPVTKDTEPKIDIKRLQEELKCSDMALDVITAQLKEMTDKFTELEKEIKQLKDDIEASKTETAEKQTESDNQHKKDLADMAAVTGDISRLRAQHIVDLELLLGKQGILNVFGGETQEDRIKSYDDKVSEAQDGKSADELKTIEDGLLDMITKNILMQANNGAIIGANEDDQKIAKKVKAQVDRKKRLKNYINGE